MPIKLEPFEHGYVCQGAAWSVTDKDLLADRVAKVALGQARHVRRILTGANVGPPTTSTSVKTGAIALITVNGSDPYHRDGWMFQVMSWLAAIQANPTGLIRAPHMIHAHKGFDGLQIEIDNSSGGVAAAIIFEDKATDNPRTTIRDEVWPEFLKLESGKYENVLVAEVTSILETQTLIDPDNAIQNIIWREVRRYRISITVGDMHSCENGRPRLFKHYELKVAGHVNRRRAEIFHVQNLRNWMEDLAARAIKIINS